MSDMSMLDQIFEHAGHKIEKTGNSKDAPNEEHFQEMVKEKNIESRPVPEREYVELRSSDLAYAENPYRPYDGDDFQALVEDIGVNGVLEPIIVRDLGEGTPLQILAGSNRNRANIAAGNETIPAVIVRNISDDEAKIITVGTNRLTRDEEKLLPSERAFAYKMLLDAEKALRREARRAGRPMGDNIGEILGGKGNTSRAMFYRYLSLTNLENRLLNLVDTEEIPVLAGFHLSVIDAESQQKVLSILELDEDINIDVKKAAKLADYHREDILTAQKIESVLRAGQEGRKRSTAEAKVPLKKELLADLYPGAKTKLIAEKIESAVLFKEKTLPNLLSRYGIEVHDDEEIEEILVEAFDNQYGSSEMPRFQKADIYDNPVAEEEENQEDEHL